MTRKKYYDQAIAHPNPLLSQTLAYFEEHPPAKKTAMDLGCGSGRDTLALLQRDWTVYALDKSPLAMEYVSNNIPENLKSNLTLHCASFEATQWKPVTLVNASLSLSFCPPSFFPEVCQQMIHSIVEGGVFSGHFFGERDSWDNLVLITKAELMHLFQDFELIYFKENELNAPSTSEAMKHWHVFEVVGVKRKR